MEAAMNHNKLLHQVCPYIYYTRKIDVGQEAAYWSCRRFNMPTVAVVEKCENMAPDLIMILAMLNSFDMSAIIEVLE